jgi:transcriptional regulator with XRE-family HTH domain
MKSSGFIRENIRPRSVESFAFAWGDSTAMNPYTVCGGTPMTTTPMATLIATRRKALGLTQQQLAEKLHLTNKAISKWETGEGLPDISVLKDLAAVLQISTDELLGASTQHLPPQTTENHAKRSLPKTGRMALRIAMLACLLLPFVNVPLSDVLPDWLGLDATFDGLFGHDVTASVTGWQMINLSTTGLLLIGGILVEAILLVLDAFNQLEVISRHMRLIAHGALIGFALALIIVTIILKLSPQIGMILWLVFSLSLNLTQLRSLKTSN